MRPFQELEGDPIIFVLAGIVEKAQELESEIAILNTFIVKKQKAACLFYILPVDMMIG